MQENVYNKEIAKACQDCLTYFSLFKYPLNKEEIHAFNRIKCSITDVDLAIESLLVSHKIYCIKDFYMLENIPSWVDERLIGNKRALDLLARSNQFVKRIAQFPFVEAVSISGSLSKYYASKNSDIDYFIITKANRLWITRTLLHIFKKFTFINGTQHFYCMNYFIDTKAMELDDDNLYTAMELATIIPVYNYKLNTEFIEVNKWIYNYLPNNLPLNNQSYIVEVKKNILSKICSLFLNIFFPKQINKFLMRLTDAKWRYKWSKFNYSEDDYNLAFKTSVHISKNHPANYQKKILNALKSNINKG